MSTKTSKKRIAARIVLGLFGLLFALILIVFFGIQTEFASEKIRVNVEEIASESLNGRVTIGNVRGSLWSHLILSEVTLLDENGSVVARVGSATAHYAIMGVLSRSLNVSELKLEDVEVFVRQDAEGELNVIKIVPPSEEEASEPVSFKVILPDIEVKGSLVYVDESAFSERWSDIQSYDEAVDIALGEHGPAKLLVLKNLKIQLSVNLDLGAERTEVVVESAQGELAVDGLFREALTVADVNVIVTEEVGAALKSLQVENVLALDNLTFKMDSDSVIDTNVERLLVPENLGIVSAFTDFELVSPLEFKASAKGPMDDLVVNMELRTEEAGRLSVSGTLKDITEDDARIQAKVKIEEMQASKIVSVLPMDSWINADMEVDLQGLTPATAVASLKLKMGHSRVDIYTIKSADLSATWKDAKLTIDEFLIDTPYAVGEVDGEFTLAGDLKITADLKSGEQMGALTKVFKNNTQIQGKLDLIGKLDLDATPGPATVLSLSGGVSWNLKEFSMEDIVIPASTGDFQLRVSSPRADARDVSLKGKASLTNARNRDFRVSSLRADLDLQTRLVEPYESLENFLERARLSADIRVTGLRGPGVRIDDSMIQATLRETSQNRYAWTLNTNNRAISFEGGTLERASARLTGSLGLNPKAKGAAVVREIRVAGDVSGEKLKVGTQEVGAVRASLDVGGLVQDLRGFVNFEAEDLPVGEEDARLYDFESLNGQLVLAGQRAFDLDLQGIQKEDRIPRNISLRLKGKYVPTLDDFEIDEIQVSPGEDGWLFENGFSMDTRRGIYTFDEVKISQGAQEVRIDGYFRVGVGQDITAEFESFRIEDLPKQFGIEAFPPVRGVINGKISLKGSARQPEAMVDLTISDLYWEGFGPFNVVVRGTYANLLLTMAELEVEGYGQKLLSGEGQVPLRLETNGKAEVLWSRSFDVQVKFHTQELASLVDIFPALALYSLDGRAGASLSFKGLLEKPELDILMNLEDAAVVIPQQGEDLTLGPMKMNAKITYRDAVSQELGFRAEMEILDKNNDGLVLQAYSSLPIPNLMRSALGGAEIAGLRRQVLDSSLRLNMQINEYDLTKVNISDFKTAKTEGKISFHAMVDGTIGDPNAGLTFKLAGFGWDRFRDIELDIESTLSQEMLEIGRLRLEWDDDEVFTGTAKVPFPVRYIFGEQGLEDLPIQAKFQVPVLPVAKLSAMNYTFASIRGTMQANLDVQGSLSSPELTMELAIRDTLFADRKTGNVDFDVRAMFGRAAVNLAVSHEDKKSLVVVADFPIVTNILDLAAGVSPYDEGNLGFAFKADKTAISSLVPARILDRQVTNLKGTFTTDLSVSGTWDNLVPKGTLKIEGLNAFFPGFGRNVENGEVAITAYPEYIDVESMHIEESNSSLDVSGRVPLSNLKPTGVRLNLNLDNLATTGFTPMPVYASGNIQLDGDFTQALTTARINVYDLVLDIPEGNQASAHPMDLNSDIVILGRTEVESGLMLVPKLSRLTSGGAALAKIQVEIAPESLLRHPNAQVRFRGDLALDVGDGGATILGDITTSRGEVEFLGKSFRVDQGIIAFTGASPPNPRIQVEASYALDRSVTEALGPATSGDPRAVIRVSGTALRPVLRMSSDPQMTESQIIYVLVSDRPPTNAAGEEEGVASQAVAAASGLLSGMLKDRAKGFYPVDMLRLRTDETGISGVEVGKYFGKNLFFAYEYMFGADEGENTNEVRLEYQFAPRWLVGTRFGDQANGALFLYWDIF